MKKTTTFRTALALAAALVALPAFAQDQASTNPATAPATAPSTAPAERGGVLQAADAEGLPSAQAVLDNYLEVTGGREAYEKLADADYSVVGKILVPAQGIEGNYTLYMQGDKMLMVTEIAGFGEIVRGFDGETLWESSLMTGARVIDGEEEQAFLREAKFNSLLNPNEFYESMTVTGKEDIDGESAYKVEFVDKSGNAETRYYSVESGLLLRTIMSVPMQGDLIETTAEFDGYEEHMGVLMATETTQSQMGATMKSTVDEVKEEYDMGERTFDVPDELK